MKKDAIFTLAIPLFAIKNAAYRKIFKQKLFKTCSYSSKHAYFVWKRTFLKKSIFGSCRIHLCWFRTCLRSHWQGLSPRAVMPMNERKTKHTWTFNIYIAYSFLRTFDDTRLSKSVWMNSQKIKCVLFSFKLIEVRDTVAFSVDARFARNLNVILFCERKTPDLCI